MEDERRLGIGHFGRAHGVRGEVRFFPYNPDSELLDSGLTLFVPRAPDELRTLTIERARQTDKFVILQLAEVGDRDRAEQLTNLEVEVDEDVLPEPDEDEVYQKDLVGLPVSLLEGDEGESERSIGRIAGFFATGANDVLVVDLHEGDQLFVPMIDDAVAALDLEEGALLHPLDDWAPPDTEI